MARRNSKQMKSFCLRHRRRPIALHSLASVINGVQARSKDIRKRNKLPRIRSREHFTHFIRSLMGRKWPRLQISSRAIDVMNNFACDTFDKLANGAADLMNYQSKATLKEQHVRSAMKTLMPGERGADIINKADTALQNFHLSKDSGDMST